MKKIVTAFILIAMFIVSYFAYLKRDRYVILSNPINEEQSDAAFILQASALKQYPLNSVPIIKTKDGVDIPSQRDDLNNDGKWDELVFVYTLKPQETVKLILSWVNVDKVPRYKLRTNIRCGRQTEMGKIINVKTEYHTKYQMYKYYADDYPYQMSGVAWENDKIGFRHYLDGRNGRDIYGKTKSYMALDSVGILPNGHLGDNFHKMADWGRDIYSGANSFGLGGLAAISGDSLVMLGVIPKNSTQDNVDSTVYNLVLQGPVRSIFRLDFYGWDLRGAKVNVHENVTIWAGRHGYENTVTTDNLPDSCIMVTGILHDNNDMPFILKDYENKLTGMIIHDKQTYHKEWYLGTALIIPNDNLNELFNSPEEGTGILKTWCAKIKPNTQGIIKYHIYAAWELEDARFRDSTFFVNMINNEAQCQLHPASLVIE